MRRIEDRAIAARVAGARLNGCPVRSARLKDRILIHTLMGMSIGAKLAGSLRAALTPGMLVVALVLFVGGVSIPFFKVTKFWVFTDNVSVLSGLVDLARAHEWFLFAIITLFTIVFPALKLGALGAAWWRRSRDQPGTERYLRWVAHFGKWSMLDVFIVAILIVAIKASQVAAIRVDVGVYLFAVSIILTQLASSRLEARLR